METNIIYNTDCIEGMKKIPDNSIDCIITDPPYNINLTTQRKITETIKNDNLTEEEFKEFLEKVFKEVDRILKEDTFLIIFTSWKTIPLFRSVLDNYFTLKSMPLWIKNNFGIGYYTRPQYEQCFLYLKGTPPILKNAISDVWHFDKVLNNLHSCEKPIPLMRFIVSSFTKENDIVLDPFAGVGSTLIACKQLQRRYIGYEIEKRYYDIIIERLEQSVLKKWF